MIKPRNILVIRLSSLGDVILTTPVFTALKKLWPEARLTVLTKSQYIDVFYNNPQVDEIVSLGEGESLFFLARRLREKKYDLCLDLHGNLRSHILSWLLGIQVLRYKKDSLARYRLVYFKKRTAPLNRTVIERYLEPLSRFSPAEFDRQPRLYLKPEEVQWAEELLKTKGYLDEDHLIGINPGAKWQTKISNWLEFLKMFRERNARLLIFGDKKDQSFTKNIVNAVAEYGVLPVNLAGVTTLRQLFALVAKCRLLITSDSGTMHIAQALDVPVLVLIGPTVPEFGFILARERDRVLDYNLPCRPCSLHGDDHCKRGDQLCLASIKPEMVFNVIYKQLTELGIRI